LGIYTPRPLDVAVRGVDLHAQSGVRPGDLVGGGSKAWETRTIMFEAGEVAAVTAA